MSLVYPPLSTISIRYTAGTTQSVANNAITALTLLTTKTYDAGTWFNTGTGVFTAPVAGKYHCTLQCATNGSVTATSIGSNFQAILQKNGSAVAQSAIAPQQTASAIVWSAIVSDTISCVAGDTITASGYTSLTGAAVTFGSATLPMWFAVELVGL